MAWNPEPLLDWHFLSGKPQFLELKQRSLKSERLWDLAFRSIKFMLRISLARRDSDIVQESYGRNKQTAVLPCSLNEEQKTQIRIDMCKIGSWNHIVRVDLANSSLQAGRTSLVGFGGTCASCSHAFKRSVLPAMKAPFAAPEIAAPPDLTGEETCRKRVPGNAICHWKKVPVENSQ